MIWVCGNNDITLVVKYDAITITAKTNFSFIKEGDPGTNGTEYVCKIVPNVRENGSLSDYPMILNGVPNYLIPSIGQWFKVQLLRNGEKIYEGITNGISSCRELREERNPFKRI